jgi:hypothetical protein
MCTCPLASVAQLTPLICTLGSAFEAAIAEQLVNTIMAINMKGEWCFFLK